MFHVHCTKRVWCVTLCVVHCWCPLLSAVSWLSPLNIPSGVFSGSPGSLELFSVLFLLGILGMPAGIVLLGFSSWNSNILSSNGWLVRSALQSGSCALHSLLLCSVSWLLSALDSHQVHMVGCLGFLRLRQFLRHLFLWQFLWCTLSKHHPTLGVSPCREAHLGGSIPLVVQ